MFGRLAALGHQVTLVVSGFSGGESRTALDGMEVHRVGGRHTFGLVAPVYCRRRLQPRSFDMVVEDLNKVPLFAPLWAQAPVVLLVHHLFGRTAFQEASLPLATATWLLEKPLPSLYAQLPVQAVSASTADDLVARGFARERIEIIPNGVDLDFYTPDAAPRYDQPTLLYLGRLKRYKRVDLIIRAVAALRDRAVAGRLVIAGRGDAEPGLRELVSELALEDRITFLGFVDEETKRELFRRAWVHVLTSPKEGWGISNLEAAACGTPTVASDSPGLRDSVVDGATGFLVPHGDIAALAERLARVLRDAQLRERLGTGARDFAQRFSWDRAADDTERHLRNVVSAHAI